MMYGKVLLQRFEGDKTLYLCHTSIKPRMNIWKRNRPPDSVRVQEIKDAIVSQAYVPGILYCFSYFQDPEKLYIYDGGHRWNAICDIPIDFCMCVKIIKEDQDIVSDFTNINKAVPVPELFLEDTQNDAQKLTRDIVHFLCTRYKKMCSPSRHPKRPHFNRDILTEHMYTILSMYTHVHKNDVIRYIFQVNLNIQQNPDIPRDKAYLKCQENTMFLFINGIDTFVREFMNVLPNTI